MNLINIEIYLLLDVLKSGMYILLLVTKTILATKSQENTKIPKKPGKRTGEKKEEKKPGILQKTDFR